MSKPAIRVVLIGVLSAVACPTVALEDCLKFSPVEVQLSGRLEARTYAGPPNYESVAAGDRSERAFILVLPEPVCVVADAKSVDNSETQAGVREIHVRWFNGDLATLIGKEVVVRGRLSTATIAHDRTRVVLDAANAQAANKPLQPTRAAEPFGKREAARPGPRG
jgi:hypothetical protein